MRHNVPIQMLGTPLQDLIFLKAFLEFLVVDGLLIEVELSFGNKKGIA